MITQTKLASAFTCLGDKCEDTCCQNWSMLVDEATLTKYKTSDLVNAVEEEGGIHVMKRDPTTRYCIKMENGLCSIHKQFGDTMLGDACHFYPRVTRQVGGEKLMTVSPSCPEVVRLLLSLDTPFAPVSASVDRLPQSLKDYLPQGMEAAKALAVHQAFVNAAMDDATSAEQSMARISSVARSMGLLDSNTLDQSVPLYLRLADGRVPKPDYHPADAFNLLHALCGLIVASHKPISERLKKTIGDMETALKATLDWQNVQIHLAPESEQAAQTMYESWDGAHYNRALKRYLALQLSLNLFPFGGLGNNFEERITIIGVRFATVRLALSCAHQLHGALPEAEIVRIIQSLSRFMDHLGDANFSLSIYAETGWTKEARLLALFS